MKIERKTVALADIKAEGDSGEWEAVIATLGVIDKDGDIIEAGALAGQTVPIIPAHDSSAAPLGKASISESGDNVIARGRFNLDVSAARDWFAAIKFDLETEPARMEYSWGFSVLEDSRDTVDGQDVRRIKRVDLREVSPVLRGASVGTGTLSAKSEGCEHCKEGGPDTLADEIQLVTGDVESLVERIRDVAAGRKERGRKLGESVRVATVEMATKCSELMDAIAATVEEEILPDDAAVKAASRFLASEVRRRGVEV